MPPNEKAATVYIEGEKLFTYTLYWYFVHEQCYFKRSICTHTSTYTETYYVRFVDIAVFHVRKTAQMLTRYTYTTEYIEARSVLDGKFLVRGNGYNDDANNKYLYHRTLCIVYIGYTHI